jgi:hypothetical protein
MVDVLNELARQRKIVHDQLGRMQGVMLAGCPVASETEDEAAGAGKQPRVP